MQQRLRDVMISMTSLHQQRKQQRWHLLSLLLFPFSCREAALFSLFFFSPSFLFLSFPLFAFFLFTPPQCGLPFFSFVSLALPYPSLSFSFSFCFPPFALIFCPPPRSGLLLY